jgi:hypothetical protein
MATEESLKVEVMRAFQRFASSGCNALDRHQLKCAFVALTGHKPSKVRPSREEPTDERNELLNRPSSSRQRCH